jgi:hypothetical protein
MDFQLGAETFDMFRAEGRTEWESISGGSSWGLADLMKHNKSFVSVKGTSYGFIYTRENNYLLKKLHI